MKKGMKQEEGSRKPLKKLELEMQGGTGNKWANGRGGERVRREGREANNTADTHPLSLLRSQRTEAVPASVEAGTMEEDGCTIRLWLSPHNWPHFLRTSIQVWSRTFKKGGNYHLCPSQDHKFWSSTPAGPIVHTLHYNFSHCTRPHSSSHPLLQTEARCSSCCLLDLFWLFFHHCFFCWPFELSGFTFLLWWTMGQGWQGAGGIPAKRTGGSRYLLVALLLCGFWMAYSQTDDGKSVYFWETGTTKPLIARWNWALYLHICSLWEVARNWCVQLLQIWYVNSTHCLLFIYRKCMLRIVAGEKETGLGTVFLLKLTALINNAPGCNINL